MLAQSLVTGGCRLPVASLGSVATHPDYRGRGLAGSLVEMALAAARRQGVTLVAISGRRTLYTRRGAVPVQAAWEAECGPAVLTALRLEQAPWQVLRFDVGEHLQAVCRLHEHEPVRYGWPPGSTRRMLEAMLADGTGGLIAVDGAGRPAAWILYRFGGPMLWAKPGEIRLLDHCGDRRAVAHLCAAITDHHEVTRLSIRGTAADGALARIVAKADAALEPGGMLGAFIVLNAERLFEQLRPLLAERLEAETLAALSVEDDGQTATFRFADQHWCVSDRSLVSRIFVDAPPQWPPSCPQGAHRVAEALLAATPIDLPGYGVCYI
jgi:hypothetical protein